MIFRTATDGNVLRSQACSHTVTLIFLALITAVLRESILEDGPARGLALSLRRRRHGLSFEEEKSPATQLQSSHIGQEQP